MSEDIDLVSQLKFTKQLDERKLRKRVRDEVLSLQRSEKRRLDTVFDNININISNINETLMYLLCTFTSKNKQYELTYKSKMERYNTLQKLTPIIHEQHTGPYNPCKRDEIESITHEIELVSHCQECTTQFVAAANVFNLYDNTISTLFIPYGMYMIGTCEREHIKSDDLNDIMRRDVIWSDRYDNGNNVNLGIKSRFEITSSLVSPKCADIPPDLTKIIISYLTDPYDEDRDDDDDDFRFTYDMS